MMCEKHNRWFRVGEKCSLCAVLKDVLKENPSLSKVVDIFISAAEELQTNKKRNRKRQRVNRKKKGKDERP